MIVDYEYHHMTEREFLSYIRRQFGKTRNLWKVVSIINWTGNTKFYFVAFMKSQSSCSPRHTIIIRACNLYPYVSTLYSLAPYIV
jgi:hypothetical protein